MTKEQTLITEIQNILNKDGVHIPTYQEFKDISFLLAENLHDKYAGFEVDKIMLKIMKRFEELTRGQWTEDNYDDISSAFKEIGLNLTMITNKKWQPALLKKEMFVCDVKEPDCYATIMQDDNESEKYIQARRKVWFGGESPNSVVMYINSQWTVWDYLCAGNKKTNFTKNFVRKLITF